MGGSDENERGVYFEHDEEEAQLWRGMGTKATCGATPQSNEPRENANEGEDVVYSDMVANPMVVNAERHKAQHGDIGADVPTRVYPRQPSCTVYRWSGR